tara:strand:- start:256 stop:591 length:336 start_codon:yes stop_codon:yes gene_type:complete
MAISTKITSTSATKSFGTQTASKASETFRIDASEIPITLSSQPDKTNVQDALEGLGTGQGVTVSASEPSGPTEGDLWFKSNTDTLYVRGDNSWAEITDTSDQNNVDGGTFT